MKELTLKSAFGFVAAIWVAFGALLQTLLILMALDVLTGLLAGYVAKALSSNVSFRGIAKKAVILCVVAAVHVIARVLGAEYGFDVNLGGWVAAGFCIHELLSIVENSARAGVWLPKPLVEAIEKLKARETPPAQ